MEWKRPASIQKLGIGNLTFPLAIEQYISQKFQTYLIGETAALSSCLNKADGKLKMAVIESQ